MWIRSQDKTILIDAAVVYIGYHDKTQPNREIGTSGFIRGDDYIVGTYATPKRALEVLDEIQSFIYEVEYAKFLGCENVNAPSVVYQMPKK